MNDDFEKQIIETGPKALSTQLEEIWLALHPKRPSGMGDRLEGGTPSEEDLEWASGLGMEMGTNLSKGGTRFYSYLTKVLEEATASKTLGGLKLGPSVTGGNVLRRLQKLGVSSDELKYTGVADWLQTRGKAPIDPEELLRVARDNELKVKVRELASNQMSDKAELLDKMRETSREMRHKAYNDTELPFDTRKAMAKGEMRLTTKANRLEFQEPSHADQYYNTYTLPTASGLRPTGYRERLYELGKPLGTEDMLPLPHRPQYEKHFAHSRSRDLVVKMPRETIFGNTDYVDELYSRHVEEFQADTHQRVGGYLTGDPFKDAPVITRGMTQNLKTPGDMEFVHEWKFEGDAWAKIFVGRSEKGYTVSLHGENISGEPIRDDKLFKNVKDMESGLVWFVESHNLDPESMLNTFKNHLYEGDTRLAADYPFKKDWWKVQVKDQLMEAARDPNVKALSFSGGEVMRQRVGYRALPKGTQFWHQPEETRMYPSGPVTNRERVLFVLPEGKSVDLDANTIRTHFGDEFFKKVKEEGQGQLEKSIGYPKHGFFAEDLYENKVPTFIEEEFGVKPVKGRTETPQGETPVWVVPLTDTLRERLKKPQRLSWLSAQEKEGLA